MLGQMQTTPLALPHVFHRAEQMFGHKTVTGVGVGGTVTTATYADWAARVRRTAAALDALEIPHDARVGTFCWNTPTHLELYFAVPCTGRVLHTLNIRLFTEQLVYIVNHADDDVIFVERSLFGQLWPLADQMPHVRKFIVIDDGSDTPVPDDERIVDHEELLASVEPFAGRFVVDDENRAAAMCYTSGTTGNPKGVVYSHRSTVLHSIAVLIADVAGLVERDVVLPIVPMFHANAWGTPYAAIFAGASLVLPGPNMVPKAIAGMLRDHPVTADGGRADDLDGRAARALPRGRAGPAPRAVRRLRGTALAVRGVAGEDRAADHAGLGDDRDEPHRDDRAPALDPRRPVRRRARRRPGHRGPGRPAGRPAPRRPRHRARSSPGTGSRPGSCRRPGRGSRTRTTSTRTAGSSSRRTAGCAPATWRSSTSTATSSWSTARRTW